jgi:hypothetical protein
MNMKRFPYSLAGILTTLTLMFTLVGIGRALAAVWTDQADYSPGSTVTVSGDNSDGAGYVAGETVHVEASGPNSYIIACDAVADNAGSWSCGLALAADAPDGDYSYTATGLTSNVSQSGTFTVSAPATTTPTPPWIQSDQADYAPASTVTLTSGGWQPAESVSVFVNDSVGQTWQITQPVTADDNGAFTYQFQLPDSFVATYGVTATGANSGVATADFTDAIAGVHANSATGPASSPEGTAFTLYVIGTGFTSTSQVTWTPPGGTARTLTRLSQSGTQLTASVLSTDVPNEGAAGTGTTAYRVSVTGGGAAGPVNFLITEADSFTLTPQAITAATNTSFSGTVATLANTYDNQNPAEFAVTINWGDGGTSTGTVTRTGVGTYTVAGSHTYASQFWSTTVRLATTLPTSTIPIANNGTTNFASSGSLVVFTSNGYQTITYTGKTTGTNTTTFTGVSGGSGTLAVGAPVTQPFSSVTVTVTDPSPGTATASTTSPLTVTDGMTYVLGAGPFSTTEGQVYTGSSPFWPSSIYTGLVFPNINLYRLLVSNGATSAWYTLYTSGPNNYMYPNTTTGSVVFGDEGIVPYTETLYLNNGVAVVTGGNNVTVNDAGLSYFNAVNTYHPVEGSSTGSIQIGKFLDSYLGDGDHSADFTVTVHWGDGSSVTVPAVYVGANAYTVNGSHTYAEEGTYAATYDVADDGGSLLNGISTATVVVSDPAVGVTGASHSTTYGTPLGTSALATFTDPGGAEANDGTHYSATVNWGGSFGSTAGTISFAAGTFTVSAAVPYTNAGSYSPVVTVNHEGASPQSVTDTVSIGPKMLTITASSATVTYGDPAPTITPSYSGFIGSDNATNSLSTPPTCSTTYTQGSGVSGSPYTTSCSGAVSSTNYNIGYAPGSVTVSPKILTITASSATVTYGDAAPTITASYSGFIGSDNATNSLSTLPTCSTTYTQGSGVGGSPYTTSCSGAVSTNYSPSYVPGSVTVNPKTLTITASSATVTYGDPAPTITPSYNGFIGSDNASNSLSTQPTCSTTYAQGSGVSGSPYTTSCSGAVSTNYNPSYVNGSVTVNPKTLTITASSATVTYGDAAPTITPSYNGFIGSDDASNSLSTQPTCLTTYAQGSGVSGSPYPTSCSGAVSRNYSPNYVNGSVTVNKAPLTVTADSVTKILNAPNPVFTFKITGFKNGETASVLTAQPTCTSAATTTSPIGQYPIICSGAAADNYSFTYVDGLLKVIYRFDGFLQPINDTAHSQVCSSPCPMSVFKGGSTVPVKFQLKDAAGNVVQAGSLPQWVTPVNMGPTAATVDETAYNSTPTPGGSYRWDSTAQQYIYNWGTAKNQTGYWWRIGVTLDDGQTYYVTIGLR